MKNLSSFLLVIMLGAFAHANMLGNLCSRSWWPSTSSEVQSALNGQIGFDLNQACDEDGYRVIHLALIQNADLETIEALVVKGADVLAQNVAGENAVYFASQHSSREVYEYVLRASTQTTSYQTAVIRAAVEDFIAEETARLRSFQDLPAFGNEGNNTNLEEHIQNLWERIEELSAEIRTAEQGMAFRGIRQAATDLEREIAQNRQMIGYYRILLEHYQQLLKQQRDATREQRSYRFDTVEYYERYYSNYDPDTWHRNAPIGVYVSFDAGTVLKTMFDLNNTSNGLPTNCDPFLAPSPLQLPLSNMNCMNYEDRWVTSFETQVGLTAGVMVGYGFQPFPTDKVTLRVEGEYARRQIAGNSSPNNFLETKEGEFAFTHQSFSDLNTNQYFANVYADFPKLFSKAGAGLRNLTPYVGFGFGNLDPNLEYTSVWYRHKAGETLAEQGVNPDAAGTISFGNFKFEGDNSPSTQFIFGTDYTLTNRIKLGLRARLMQIHQDFTSSDHWWQLLRSHQSQVSPGGRPITYSTNVNDLNFFDVTMQLRVHLGKRSKAPPTGY